MQPEITAEYLASQGLSEDFPKRFWSKVRKTETCWLWTAFRTPFGYGRLARGDSDGGLILAHVASWILHRGPVPDGLFVLHNCPNKDCPSCINPDHLWTGTKSENTQDSVKKGTWILTHPGWKGEAHSQNLLTEKDVIKIRSLHDSGELNQRTLAKRFGVSFQNINLIVLRKRWTHI